MDNNFEEQFMQNVKNAAGTTGVPKESPETAKQSGGAVIASGQPEMAPGQTQVPNMAMAASTQSIANMKPVEPAKTTSPLALIVALVLAVVVIIESIALVLTLSNYFALTDDSSAEVEYGDSETVEYVNSYNYDSNDNLIAFELSCTAEDGTRYDFKLTNTYKQLGASGNELGNGEYKIVNGNLIQLPASGNTEKVLYYDGLNVADGTKIYRCAEVVTSESTENGE